MVDWAGGVEPNPVEGPNPPKGEDGWPKGGFSAGFGLSETALCPNLGAKEEAWGFREEPNGEEFVDAAYGRSSGTNMV